jgi:molybdopterin/thiamine biosynthesis adenylyltransferase/rhodanese-related sulfurtransferase
MFPIAQKIAARAINQPLSPKSRERFKRHILLSEIDEIGQAKIAAAKILIIGAGGLGSPASLYLAAAGVETIGIVDFDMVDRSNLQRQTLYNDADVGRRKIEVAKEKLNAQSPDTTVEVFPVRLNADNALDLIRPFDLVIDGSDNFATRYIVNDACVTLEKPNIYGSVFRFEGQASVFYPPHGPCYRCAFPEPPATGTVPNCAEGGVLGVLPGQIGIIQATEALKLILGLGDSLVGRLLLYDALAMNFQSINVKRSAACTACGDHAAISSLATQECMSPDALRAAKLKNPQLFVLDVRTAPEVAESSIPGSVHIPLNELEARLDLIPRDRAVVTYCKSGPRSLVAQKILKAHGYRSVKNLDGGISAWQSP